MLLANKHIVRGTNHIGSNDGDCVFAFVVAAAAQKRDSHSKDIILEGFGVLMIGGVR